MNRRDKKTSGSTNDLMSVIGVTDEHVDESRVASPPVVLPEVYIEAYNHREVLTLKDFSEWTWADEQMHRRYNRLLQPGFLHDDPRDLLKDAKLVGANWLTDVCCPSVKAAIFLHVAKEMVVNYKVQEADLNYTAQSIYKRLVLSNPDLIDTLEKNIEDKLNAALQADGKLNPSALLAQADALLKRNHIDEPTSDQIEAAKRVVINIERKRITDELVSKAVSDCIRLSGQFQSLEEKSMHDIGSGETHDYCFLGAAGSGKSTLARAEITDKEKADYVVLATDNYRAFYLPGTESHERVPTKNVFARTQDTAYLIKELILNDVTKMSDKRPTVICDCITLDYHMRKLVSQGEVTSFVAGFRGEPGYLGIAERADNRARDVDASAADKGRFVETTSLMTDHANGSQRLLTSIPDNAVTKVFNTSIERGEKAVLMAEVDTAEHMVKVFDLRVFSEFMNKKKYQCISNSSVGIDHERE